MKRITKRLVVAAAVGALAITGVLPVAANPAAPASAVTPATPAARAATLDTPCSEAFHADRAQGQVCRAGDHYKVRLRDGSTVQTHGPDRIRGAVAAAAGAVGSQGGATATPQPVACGATTAPHFHALYAVPSGSTDRYATYAPLVHDGILLANGFVHAQTLATTANLSDRTLPFDCDGGGNPVVQHVAPLPTACASSNYSTITSDLRAMGFNDPNTKYWVFFDCASPMVAGFSGQAALYGDDSASPSNANNSGNMIAVEYNYNDNVFWDVALHEASHTMGAVQLTAPNSSGNFHCNDGLDIMCYSDGGSRSAYSTSVCTVTQYDCNHDDYFNPMAVPGTYLAQHWNVGGPYNHFLWGPAVMDNITPAYGPAVGGTQVTVAGSGFLAGVTSVTVAGVTASGVSVLTDSTLTFNTPGGAAGYQDVMVNGVHGSSQPQKFFYTPHVLDASSTSQYTLTGSDGLTWQPIDNTNLSLSFTPPVDSVAVISANADLFTATPGNNQDLGIYATPSDNNLYPANIVAWKESGGFAGTFSPNAAYVHTVLPLSAGTAYSVGLRWKTNHAAPGATIYAGAGPLGGTFSTSRLTVEFLPAQTGLGATVSSARSTSQYTMTSGDGVTWQDLDAARLGLTISPAANVTALISANVDLFTANAGFNQDLGIYVSPSDATAYPGGIVGWKESGGFAGTYSPNAAFVQAAVPMTAGTSYAVRLRWKTNKAAPGVTIYAGAGGGAPFSPSQLTVQLVPQAGSGVTTARSTAQYTLNNNDGSTWADIDPSALHLALPPGPGCTNLVSANTDLFTAAAGVNQDVAVASVGVPVLAWKESGGFAGSFSPNAAQVLGVTPLAAGAGADLRVRWKTNIANGASTVYSGAGAAAPFSPTTLVSQLVDCLPLTITSGQALPTAVSGTAFQSQFTAQNGALPYTWSASGLPSGLTMNPATGLLSGQPSSGSPSAVTVTVQDATGAQASRRYTLLALAAAPGVPGNVTATPAGKHQVHLAWTAPPDNGSPLTGYRVTGTPASGGMIAPNLTSVTVGCLAAGTAYSFTLSAANAVGVGAASAPTSPVTTPAATATGFGWGSCSGQAEPPPRHSAAMAYDAARSEMVLFGGIVPNPGGGGLIATDTWVRDGVVWSRRTPAHSPGYVQDQPMIYDSVRQLVVLPQGASTWEWNGTDWTQRTPAVSPPSRIGAGLVYDSARQRTLLFGGLATAGYTALNDTWSYDGTTWTQLTPLSSPSARAWPAMSFDTTRNVAVLYGGTPNGGAAPVDTWEWNGTNWTQRTVTGAPGAAAASVMAYDSNLGVSVLWTGGGSWNWNPVAATWTQYAVSTAPVYRDYAAFAYDSARHVSVLYGGGAYVADTWEGGAGQ